MEPKSSTTQTSPARKPALRELAANRSALIAFALIVLVATVTLIFAAVRRHRVQVEQTARAAVPAILPPVAFAPTEPTPAPLPLRPRTRVLPPVKRAGGISPPAESSSDIVDYLIDRFVLGYGRAIRICDNLSANLDRVPASMAQFEADIRASQARGATFGNRLTESALIPIATALEIQSLGEIVESIELAKNMQDPKLVASDEFRSKVSLASADAITQRAELSRRAQHAYHLFVLGRATLLAPALANNSQVLNFCAHEQVLATTGASESHALLETDKVLLLKILASGNLTPEQVGYDPNLQNEVVIRISAARISIEVPWMLKQFGGPFQINNSQAQTEIISGSTTGADQEPGASPPAH